MIIKPFKLSGFAGINNVAKGEQLSPQELSGAYNFDLTNAKSLRRRRGRRSIFQGDCHSLSSDGEYLYFRSGGDLLRYDTTDDSYSTLRSGFVASNVVSYLPLGGKVYYSDGVLTGVVEGGADRSWGLVAPQKPVVASTTGSLTSGSYSVAITYARADGQESGSSVPVLTRAATGLAISSIPQPTDAGVAYIIVYVTPCNASSLYRAAVLPVGTTSLDIRGAYPKGMVLKTLHLNAPPAGQLVEFYNGRIYIAAGDTLWYTNPYQNEHVDYRFNYMQFDGRITMLKAVSNGIWLGAGGLVHFLGGDDPMSENAPLGIRYSFSYPAIEGTACLADGKAVGDGRIIGPVTIWASKKGVCVGTSDGTLLNATEKRFKPPDVSQGVATIVNGGDFNQYLFALQVGPNGGALRLPQFRA